MRKDNGDAEGKRGLKEEGVGIGRGKDICVVGQQGVESVVRIACFCQKRQDSDKLSSPCSHLSPLTLPVTHAHASTHTHIHTHSHNAQFTTKMNGLPQRDTSQLQGEMVLVRQQKTEVLWGAQPVTEC